MAKRLGRNFLKNQNTIKGYIDTEVADVLTDTGTTIPGTITTLQGNVTSILEDTGTTIPTLIGTPADTDIATDIANLDMVVDGVETKVDTVDGIVDNLLLYAAPVTVTGTADIDISESDYTGYITLLTIAPDSAKPLADLVIDLDYAKETTGIDSVATASDTLDVAIFSKIDGTNERMLMSNTQVTLAGDGTVAHNGDRFIVGAVSVSQQIIVKVKLSAERDDAEVPYSITYRALGAPTVTPVAAA
jgi:hypothetical protein